MTVPAQELDHNPLAEGLLDFRVRDPSLMIIFGATGDLSARKLLPAIYNLAKQRLLPVGFAVIGAGTDSSIAASTVQRPSPVSSTKPLMRASSGSLERPSAMRSSNHDRTTLPVRHDSAIACMSIPGKDLESFMISKPSA